MRACGVSKAESVPDIITLDTKDGIEQIQIQIQRCYESKNKPYQGDLNTSLPGERCYGIEQRALHGVAKTSALTAANFECGVVRPQRPPGDLIAGGTSAK